MSQTTDALRAELSRLKSLPDDEARAMPAEFYTSEAFLTLEEEHVFRNDWVCLCRVGEVAREGDFFTTELVGEQLIVVRETAQDIAVLSNVCRHRGNQVETASKGNRRRFVCGYHAWTYGLDGALKAAPLMKGSKAFDQSTCALPRFRTEVWQNFLFVNLSGTADPLAPRMAGLSKLMTNYHHELRHLNFMAEDVWATNWKSLVENFLEGYHLSATHLKTLHPITPTRLCRKIPGGAGYTGYHAFYDPDWPDRGPFHADLTAEERRNSILTCAYPSFAFSIATHYTLFMCLRPAGVGKVAIRWGVAGFGDDPDTQEVADYVKLCQDFNAEDREKLEALAVALKSRYYSPGPLAPDDFEGTIRDFLGHMADRLGAEVPLAPVR